MNFENEDFNKMADEFLQRIEDYINVKLASGPTVKPAEVSRVNLDGTVDVFFPPDKDKLFTRIKNQSIYQDLKAGDQVYLFYPQGNKSSCWICAKFKGEKVNFNSSITETKIINNINMDTSDLAEIAKTGNVNDLIQTEGDTIIFKCGKV